MHKLSPGRWLCFKLNENDSSVGCLARGAAFGQCCHSRADIVRADVVGVEGTPIPLQHGFVLGMARLCNGVEKLLEPRRAADIFGKQNAGLSENLRAQIRGIRQAKRNAQDGVSLIQVRKAD